MKLAFPITDIATYAIKTKVIAGDIDALMHFYHAENDTSEHITDEYFEATKEMVLKML